MEAIVCDLGGTHLRCAGVDEDGRLRLIEKNRILSEIYDAQTFTDQPQISALEIDSRCSSA